MILLMRPQSQPRILGAEPPEGVDAAVWIELLRNASTVDEARSARRWLVESRSLPRSGHNYLKRLLQHACGEGFSYCEGQLEPGCCKTSPCRVTAYWQHARRRGVAHLRLIKSHDIDLKDPVFETPPAMLRLIQVRRPLPLLASWLELDQLAVNRKLLREAEIRVDRIYLLHEPALLEQAWGLIDASGTVMSPEQAQAMLNRKLIYVIAFLRKWMPLVQPFPFDAALISGHYLLPYEQLDRSEGILSALGLGSGCVDHRLSRTVEPFVPRSDDLLQRASARVSELLRRTEPALRHAEAQILRNVPALQKLYSGASASGV